MRYNDTMATKKTTKTRASNAEARATTSKKSPAKKRVVKRAVKSTKVDYYPNRMTVAISALAGTLLMLITLISVLGATGKL